MAYQVISLVQTTAALIFQCASTLPARGTGDARVDMWVFRPVNVSVHFGPLAPHCLTYILPSLWLSGPSCTECDSTVEPMLVLGSGFKCSACPKHRGLTISLVLGASLVVVGYLTYTIKEQQAEARKLRSALCHMRPWTPITARLVSGNIVC